MRKHRIIFIGAGVSNLTAANYLLDNSVNDFLILDKGQRLEDRLCPGVEDKKCYRCENGCATLEGIGGANALNGNKLCYFPASNNILSIGAATQIKESGFYLKSISNNIIEPSLNVAETGHNQQKSYISDILKKKGFNSLICKLTHKLNGYLIANCEVASIIHEDNLVRISTTSGQDFYANQIVIGSGRSSYRFLKNYFDDNEIEYDFLAQDIGIRLEADKYDFSKSYYYQNDPKYKFTFEGLGSARTFCATNKGEIIPVKFGDSFYAEGSFADEYTDFNNIALMVRTKKPLSVEELESWCSKVNGSADNLLLGEVAVSNDSKKLISEIMRTLPCLPSENHNKLLRLLLGKILDSNFNILSPNSNGKLKIYGPAIDRYWLNPKLNNDLSLIGRDNVFVIGDAAGKSRGYIQAMYSGYIWASKFLLTATKRSVPLAHIMKNATNETWLNLE